MDYAVGLHPAKLLDEHLLGNRRDRAFQVGKAQDLAAKQVKQDDELPAAFWILSAFSTPWAAVTGVSFSDLLFGVYLTVSCILAIL